ncbi:uncharacterized protein EV420DRAFT_1474859 [Desarmillaria tabescens]|uniref:Uncharacterized protein n=1 Tax=Armillaria tabescens TaxID=1929756 RepID=A0AA39NI34_ARMTA|nr:uncharacterized protein EV420DRAFT_1474859 [Desarmillaria tabescens]KAK0466053.1 hypothetical protein EV420DRAFT_1474859 [Desarmillaria tabescens]
MDTSGTSDDTMPESRRPLLPGEYTTGSTDNLDTPHSTIETPAPSDSSTALQHQGTRMSTPTSQSSETKKTWKERFGLVESKSKTTPTEGSKYGIAETRIDPSTGGVIIGPGTRPHSTCLYLRTSGREEAIMAYHRFSPCAPDPDEIPEPEEFDTYQHDWALMDTWHQANQLPPLEDGERPEFDLQYPDSPTIPGYPDLSITTGRSNAVTRRSTGSDISDPYNSWVTDNKEHNLYAVRDELADHHLSPYGECHGDICHWLQAIAEDRRRDWETPEPLVSYVKWTLREYGAEPELANFFFDNPVHSEWDVLYRRTEIGPLHEGEAPTYQRDKNSPYYHDPRTSPSISGLEILRPGSGTAGTHGSMLPSPTTATGSQSQTQRSPRPIPDQPPNPARKKAVIEMDWEELLEWQKGSLANEGSWIITEATKLMYQPQLPNMVRNAIYEDEVHYHAAKLWNQLHNDKADVL